MIGSRLTGSRRRSVSLHRVPPDAVVALLLIALLTACAAPLGTATSPYEPAAVSRADAEQPTRGSVQAPSDAGARHDLNYLQRRRGTVASPSAAPPAPAATTSPRSVEPFAMNLFEAGDFVPQYTFEWCVAASIQMAWNMVQPAPRTARGDQQALWELARDRSNNPYRGADPGGWAEVLNEIGLGPYELVSVPEYDEALRVAAAAMHDTSRPVGLVMWRGRHAWVMNGFRSMGEPSADSDFEVTGVHVVDPLYPHGSGTWGPSPEPNALLTPDQLAKQFVFREQRRWSAHVPAGFLLVLPMAREPIVQPRGPVTGPRSIPR